MTYYDAEIEYLKSTGTQIIFFDNYIVNPNTEYYLTLKFDNRASNWSSAIKSIYAGITTGGDADCVFSVNFGANGNQTTTLYWWTNKTYQSDSPVKSKNYDLTVLSNKNTIHYTNGNISYGGINFEVITKTTTNGQGFTLFGAGSTTPFSAYDMYVYNFKLIENSIVIHDFIPVRIGSVGYMYDKVSDTLFGNSGTGSFTLGPDVAGWPGVTGKPKVSSIRRQMIQLMPKKPSVYDGMGTKNLYFHLSGQDAPVNGKWVDRIRNSQWTLTGVTHTDDYYYFNSRKPSSGAADVWASCSNLYSNFDLGEQWAMEIDIEFTSDTTSGQIVDFNSVTGVSAGRCGISAGFWQTTTGKASATMQVKPNGNDIVTWATDLSLNLESQEGEWSNAKLIVLCKKVNDTQSQLLIYSNGVLNRQSDLFTAVRYNRFDGTAFLGRAVTNSGNYKYQITPFRLKDFKIYTFI